MRFDVLTLFPPIFSGYLEQSLLGKAIERGCLDVHVHDMRDWSSDPHHKVDDRPYGGGPGMVLQVGPVVECVEAVRKLADEPAELILLTPQGKPLNQRVVEELVEVPRLIVICGRYEGFDQRIIDILQPTELSIGDYVLNGGEVAAMVLVDSVMRLIPGVLGDESSNVDDSFSSGNRLLEFPQYTRPREYRGHDVPEVLLSGDHEAIARWRAEQTVDRTKERRGDLLKQENNPGEGSQ